MLVDLIDQACLDHAVGERNSACIAIIGDPYGKPILVRADTPAPAASSWHAYRRYPGPCRAGIAGAAMT